MNSERDRDPYPEIPIPAAEWQDIPIETIVDATSFRLRIPRDREVIPADIKAQVRREMDRCYVRFIARIARFCVVQPEIKNTLSESFISVPDSWWDHWKDAHKSSRLFGWIARRWPPLFTSIRTRSEVTTTRITENRWCPHIKADGNRDHLYFLISPEPNIEAR